jgi:hypothetical protein
MPMPTPQPAASSAASSAPAAAAAAPAPGAARARSASAARYGAIALVAWLAPAALPSCHAPPAADAGQVARPEPAPVVATEGDADADGLLDEEERQLAERFAPVVTLEKHDWTRPASARWLLERVAAPRGGFSKSVRQGSSEPADWTTYVHVFPTTGPEAIQIQYWFFYPYNDGPLMFNHESDWEHVTVTLDAERNPVGVSAARHSNCAPGKWRAWDRLGKFEGTHPEILSASGSHASYFDAKDARFYDRVGRCDDGEPCAHPRWLTWKSGGLTNLGERRAPLDGDVMAQAERWGRSGLLPGTDAPRGPSFQRGWCVPLSAACR